MKFWDEFAPEFSGAEIIFDSGEATELFAKGAELFAKGTELFAKGTELFAEGAELFAKGTELATAGEADADSNTALLFAITSSKGAYISKCCAEIKLGCSFTTSKFY